MKTIRTISGMLFCALLFITCRKTIEAEKNEAPASEVATGNSPEGLTGSVYTLSNDVLLQLVLSGSGGRVFVGSACTSCQADSAYIDFPVYTPPVNQNGMLAFNTMNDYDAFVSAANLMEDYWAYPKLSFEDTPEEIYHLGEESFNAMDAALGLNSLRALYELNEFNNYNWQDTAGIVVDDEDYQLVMNRQREVKIGATYYKCISNNMIAAVKNNNLEALNMVRRFDFQVIHPDVSFYNELAGRYEGPSGTGGPSGTNGCADFGLNVYLNNLTPLTSTANQWDVELKTAVYYQNVPFQTGVDFSTVLGIYSVNWGDGTTTDFTGTYVVLNRLHHIYNMVLAPGTAVSKEITVTCRLLMPQAPSGGLTAVLNACPELVTKVFTTKKSVLLSSPATEDCMSGNHKREFYGAQLSINGNYYRLKCKIKQKTGAFLGFASVLSTVVFEKKKGARWKKSKPLFDMTLNLRGKVFNENTCTRVFKTINKSKSTTSKKKLKIRDTNVSRDFRSRRSLPEALQSDYIWKYDPLHSIGEYYQVIKP